MGKRVSQQTRDELIKALGARYEQSGREDKARILDEFARITGYHRKHAIRLLGGQHAAALVDGDVSAQVVGVGRDRIYDEAFVATLIVFWETADRIWLFESLQLERPERYSSGQLRTLQRRVKAWRTKEARRRAD